jgi:hypothetical protein
VSFSQNVRFSGRSFIGPDEARPSGHGIAQSLAALARAAGWESEEVESWRDSGWSITCRSRASRLEITISEVQPAEWLLQIAPAFVPGFVSRLRGRRPSADRDDVHGLALRVHEFLRGEFGAQLWCWDGFPYERCSTAEPLRWRAAG